MTKRIRTKIYGSKKKDYIDLILVILFGLILTASLVASIYEKYGEYTFASVLFTGLFWSTIEILTPKAKHWAQALIRFIPALILGIIFGGILTYYTQFGYYLIEPALSGNAIAIFSLAMVIYASLVIVWTAVWSHQHQYIAFRR